MPDMTDEEAIVLEMERQEAATEQDLLDRIANAFDRADKGAEVEAVWSVVEAELALRAERAEDERDAAVRHRDQAENRAALYRQQVADLKAAIERVRALHSAARAGDTCYACGDDEWLDGQCPTIRALDNPTDTTGDTNRGVLGRILTVRQDVDRRLHRALFGDPAPTDTTGETETP